MSNLESGLMWLPKDAPWLGEFEAELLGFPAARHDDQVDSLSQYFGWVREWGPTIRFECHWIGDEDRVDHHLIAERLSCARGGRVLAAGSAAVEKPAATRIRGQGASSASTARKAARGTRGLEWHPQQWLRV
jgi:hypothetical protein